MIIHSDSELGALLTLVVLFGGFLGIVISVVLLFSRNFRGAAKCFLGSLGVMGLYAFAVVAIAWLTPQRIINIGDSYCMDIWCIGIQNVNRIPREQDILYKVDVRIFSDANSVKISAKGAVPYLIDDRGRRFELIHDASVLPFDTALDPRQSIQTTLTFAVAADAGHLFLPCGYHRLGEEPSVPFWVKLYFGNDAGFLHKQTLLRVL